MYLSPSPYNKQNETVREVQRMLNSLKLNFHHEWPYITEDGIYGKMSASAVKGFQQYRGIFSQSTENGPILGDTTIEYIRQEYLRVPVLSAVKTPVMSHVPPREYSFGVKEFTDAFMGVIDNFDSYLKNELQYVCSMTTNNPQALNQRYKSMATRLDPRMKEMKELLKKVTKPGKQTHKKAVKIQAQRINLAQELEKFDIVGKIEKKLAAKGIKSEYTVGKGKMSGNIKLKGGGIFVLWSFKDLIGDLIKVDCWGTPEWTADLKKHFLEFLDGFILGIAAGVIAEMVIAAVAAGVVALGYTMPVWLIVALVAILALLIAAALQFLLDEAEVSFSETVITFCHDKLCTIFAKWGN